MVKALWVSRTSALRFIREPYGVKGDIVSISDEMSFGYRRKTKINRSEPRLPVIDFQKRVINFGDDLELFKIVSAVDHDPS